MRKVNIHYRYLENDSNNIALDLSNLIKQALSYQEDGISLRDRSGLRVLEHQDEVIILNRCDEREDYVFGELASFRPGEHIKVIEDASEQRVLNLEQIDTPEGRHPLRGVTYFLIINNHVLVIQAANISINTLKKYLSWLLNDKTLILRDQINLAAQISVNDENAPPIDEIKIRPPKSPVIPLGIRTTDVVRSAGESHISEQTKVFEILQAAGFGEPNLERLRERAAPDGELQLELAIKIKQKRKCKPLSFADAAYIVSEIEDDEIILRGKHGKQVGKLIKLSYPIARVEENGSLLVPDDALRALIEAFRYFVQNRYITSDVRQWRD